MEELALQRRDGATHVFALTFWLIFVGKKMYEIDTLMSYLYYYKNMYCTTISTGAKLIIQMCCELKADTVCYADLSFFDSLNLLNR